MAQGAASEKGATALAGVRVGCWAGDLEALKGAASVVPAR